LVRVTSAREMYDAVHNYFEEADVVIAAAAVADYKPRVVAAQKMKKKEAVLSIELEPTQDILASLGEAKKTAEAYWFCFGNQ
jgi:phosphopantothenoylcysteine decarboxylase / phosphopantothenate---cysteine ligase